MANTRKWFREMVAYAVDLGIADARIEYGGRHPRIVGTYRGREIRRSVAGSPSDSRFARVKARRDLERAISRT